MAQTHVQLYVHVVFSTKNRVNLITPEIEAELYAYIGGVIRKSGSKLIAGNGTPDHSHLLISLEKSTVLPNLIRDTKRASSAWLRDKGGMLGKFGWQDGYSAFSVGHTQLQAVIEYIGKQKSHHAKHYFEDEMRSFYRKYKIDFDEQRIWG